MLHISMFDFYKAMTYLHWIHILLLCSRMFQARRHTTEIHFDQLRGRAISELEKDTITSLSTENLSGESYDDSAHKSERLICLYVYLIVVVSAPLGEAGPPYTPASYPPSLYDVG